MKHPWTAAPGICPHAAPGTHRLRELCCCGAKGKVTHGATQHY